LTFEPLRAIKAQALAEFLAVNTTLDEEGDSRPRPWSLYVDSSSTKDGSGACLIIKSPDRAWYEHALKFMVNASNNEAEYEALIAGIKLCDNTGGTLFKLSPSPS